jgi:hypothetical protein
MHLIERLTITDSEDALKYEFKVEDPTTWTKTVVGGMIWPRIEPGLYEFAATNRTTG